jgi:DNA-binding MarR family transcriptional regulator
MSTHRARATARSRTESLHQLENEVAVLLRRLKRVVGERAVLVHPELQSTGYLMLAWVAEEGPARASRLADHFHVDKAAISRQLQQLQDLGLVTRTPDPADGRATLVSATEEAVTRLEEITVARRRMLDDRLGDWSAEDLDEFARMLARYNKTLA